MTGDAPAISQLEAAQSGLVACVQGIDDAGIRDQFHDALSPIGWHLQHCAYIESFWLREIAKGDDQLTAPLRDQCVPELSPKDLRGIRLPPKAELLSWADAVMAENRSRLGDMVSGGGSADGHAPDYLADFLTAHHAQHLETMAMGVVARHLAATVPVQVVRQKLDPAPVDLEMVDITPGPYRIGATDGFAYDNERPARMVEIRDRAIGRRPVSNAAFLAFMADRGYQRPELWSAAGWAWCTGAVARHPYHWRTDQAGHWYEITPNGPHDLDAAAPIHGLGRFEAGAFARWAGALLPHEFEWEAAAGLDLLEGVGGAWEWCANGFHPYPGFRAFPYREYSAPWYDTRHYVLRGASRHTWPVNRRLSFRNYYTADCRHIFAGLRLAA